MGKEKTKSADNGNSDAEQPAAGTRLSAPEIYRNVLVLAKEELDRPLSALFWSALTAGLVIGFSFLAAAYLTELAPAGWKSAAGAVGYPLGFIFVVLARNQLFTENTLEPIIPLLNEPTRKMFRQVLYLWGAILLGNLLGALLFAALLVHTPMIDPAFRGALDLVADHSTSGGAGRVLYLSVFGGWLLALMTWLIAATRATGAQLVMVWLTTAPISAFGFRHSIVGAVEAFYRAFAGSVAWDAALLRFTLPAVIGNIIGGVLFVALLNHAQVNARRES